MVMTLVGHSPWAAASSPGDGKVEEKVAGNIFTAWTAAAIELILKNLVPQVADEHLLASRAVSD